MTSSDRHWYIGFVKPCQEKRTAELLTRLGFANYLPIQRVKHKWSDRIKIVDQLVLPRMIFLYGTDEERRRSLAEIPMLYAYMMDHGLGKPAVIKDKEMNDFRLMVEHGEQKVHIKSEPFAPGDHVRVVNGPMSGLECEFISSDGRSGLALVRLGALGAATVSISRNDLKKIETAPDGQ